MCVCSALQPSFKPGDFFPTFIRSFRIVFLPADLIFTVVTILIFFCHHFTHYSLHAVPTTLYTTSSTRKIFVWDSKFRDFFFKPPVLSFAAIVHVLYAHFCCILVNIGFYLFFDLPHTMSLIIIIAKKCGSVSEQNFPFTCLLETFLFSGHHLETNL